jgi:hypothetical protein
MLEFFVYVLMVITTILLSLNTMPVSFHFRKFWRDAMLNDENNHFKSTIVSSIIISVVFTMLSIVYILSLCDLFYNKELITISLIVLTAVLTTKASLWKIVDKNLRDNIKPYFNNLITAFGYALIFSVILAAIYYMGFNPDNLHKANLLDGREPNIYKLFVAINNIKSEFYSQLTPFVDSRIIQLIFTFLTFTQSFFIFYYTSILSGTFKNIKQIDEKRKKVIFPVGISVLILSIFYFNQNYLSDETQKVVKAEKNISDSVESNPVLKTNLEELQKENLLLRNDLKSKSKIIQDAKASLECLTDNNLSIHYAQYLFYGGGIETLTGCKIPKL